MSKYIVVSRYPNSPHYKIEGIGYTSEKDARNHIRLFIDREVALAEVQKKHGLDSLEGKIYWVGEVTIPDKFFQD